MSKVNLCDSDDNGLEFVNFGMIFVGSQLVSASVASPRMGCVPEAAGAHALQNKQKPGWLPGQFLVNQWDSL